MPDGRVVGLDSLASRGRRCRRDDIEKAGLVKVVSVQRIDLPLSDRCLL